MDVEITIDDPTTYTGPWTAMVRLELLPDADLGENLCAVGSQP
jgi:hypothetical protein